MKMKLDGEDGMSRVYACGQHTMNMVYIIWNKNTNIVLDILIYVVYESLIFIEWVLIATIVESEYVLLKISAFISFGVFDYWYALIKMKLDGGDEMSWVVLWDACYIKTKVLNI